MRILFRGCLGILGLVAAFLLVVCVIEPTAVAVREHMEIVHAVKHARTIELVHYNPGIGSAEDLIVYARKKLEPSDFHRVLDTMPLVPDTGIWSMELMCLFNPHHKIIVTDSDGRQTVIRVCFECDHVRIDQGDTIGTPWAWRGRLRKFFADEGMADKSSADYRRDLKNARLPKTAP